MVERRGRPLPSCGHSGAAAAHPSLACLWELQDGRRLRWRKSNCLLDQGTRTVPPRPASSGAHAGRSRCGGGHGACRAGHVRSQCSYSVAAGGWPGGLAASFLDKDALRRRPVGAALVCGGSRGEGCSGMQGLSTVVHNVLVKVGGCAQLQSVGSPLAPTRPTSRPLLLPHPQRCLLPASCSCCLLRLPWQMRRWPTRRRPPTPPQRPRRPLRRPPTCHAPLTRCVVRWGHRPTPGCDLHTARNRWHGVWDGGGLGAGGGWGGPGRPCVGGRSESGWGRAAARGCTSTVGGDVWWCLAHTQSVTVWGLRQWRHRAPVPEPHGTAGHQAAAAYISQRVLSGSGARWGHAAWLGRALTARGVECTAHCWPPLLGAG